MAALEIAHLREIDGVEDMGGVSCHDHLGDCVGEPGSLGGILDDFPDIGDEGLLHLSVEMDLGLLNENQKA